MNSVEKSHKKVEKVALKGQKVFAVIKKKWFQFKLKEIKRDKRGHYKYRYSTQTKTTIS